MSRRTVGDLRAHLERLDGEGYGAYKQIRGPWRAGDDAAEWTLEVVWVQGDPFATPSRIRLLVPSRTAALDAELLRNPSRRVGVACALARSLEREARTVASVGGSGRSGEVRVEAPRQEVLAQTAVQVNAAGDVEARIQVGLPARGRRILGRAAATLLGSGIPALVARTLLANAHPDDDLLKAAEVNEDADHLRASLRDRNLVAFVADGSILPRVSGVDDAPLGGSAAVPFRSPDSLRVELHAPNRGAITGMGVRRGVTLIVGGGFHGKSTLLRAVERGVINHRPGDGREYVVADRGAVKIRAEDGRSVVGVDISPLISALPGGVDTAFFSTENASGSTSQAAAIVEALEAGATALLIDEDTAATNFMIRDRRMQELVPPEKEPITPFVDRVRGLVEELGVSSVLALGGSGDYLDVADTVIAMEEYRARDVTGRARTVARDHPTGRHPATGRPLHPATPRYLLPRSIDARSGKRREYVKVSGTDGLRIGRADIDLSAVEQIVSFAQLRSIGRALVAATRFIDGRHDLASILERVRELVADGGLDALESGLHGDLAEFRTLELAAAIDRLRTLQIRRPDDGSPPD